MGEDRLRSIGSQQKLVYLWRQVHGAARINLDGPIRTDAADR